ncbi:MAG TPA: MFS transporter [Candidatus Dormibacteraeota bacterium]|nr:MFS transporter [Candidatus Dormibacteraeota bacterium]
MARLLAIREARLYLAGQGLSILGDTALWLAMGIWVKTLTGSSSAAGLVFFAFAVPQLLSPLSGTLVDRVRRRPLLIAVNLAMGTAVLPLVAVRGPGDVWLIYTVMVLYGASYTVLDSGQSALLQATLPGELLADMNGILQAVRQGLRLVSPLAGAGLFVLLGGPTVAALDSATFVAAAAALALMRVSEGRPRPGPLRWREQITAGFRHVARTTRLRQLTIAAAVAVLVLGFSESLIFAVVDRGLHRPPSFLGVLAAVQGAGGLTGGLLAGRAVRRAGEGVAFALGVVLMAAGELLLIAPSTPAALAGFAVFGGGLPVAIVAVTTLVQQATPVELQGRAYAAASMAIGVPQTLSIGLGAALLVVADYRLLLLTVAVVMAASAGYVLSRREQRPGLEVTSPGPVLPPEGDAGTATR